MHYLIFTGGSFTPSRLSEKAIKKADRILAADSGANTARNLHIFPKIVIGDLDSLDKKTENILKNKKTNFVISPREKDETDTELAIDYAVKNGATKITILGGTVGDRLDHIVANLFLATVYSIPIYFIDGNQISWVAKGPNKQIIQGRKDDLLSLIPLTAHVLEITSTNLSYPLEKDTLIFGRPRGVSNVLTTKKATVTFSEGILLFVLCIQQ